MLTDRRDGQLRDLQRSRAALVDSAKRRAAAMTAEADREREIDAATDAKLARQIGHPSYESPR